MVEHNDDGDDGLAVGKRLSQRESWLTVENKVTVKL